MSFIDTLPMKSLEQWSPKAFSIGGFAILINVILLGIANYSSFSLPNWLSTLLGLGGIWFLLIGLIGFYTLVSDATPQSALAWIITGIVGWIALSVGLAWAIILDLMNQGTIAEGPSFGPQLFISAIILSLVSFLAYGIASSRSHQPSRTVGLFFLVPFGTFFILVLIFFANSLDGYEAPGGAFLVLFGLAAVGLIGIGYSLQTGYTLFDSTEPTDTSL
ncbi:MAG: hypothetical protein ABEI06_03860 [Halobacteriaceae archaeon]